MSQNNHTPFADEIRPIAFDEVAGQSHILGEKGLLRKLIARGNTGNLIFYGPPGTGKTTVANIIAAQTKRTLYKLNATTAGLSDIKDIVSQLDTMMAMDGVLLYLDEIQYFNKKQQQSLLEHMENGKITLIASTTENPYFYVYPAILSRSTVFEFKPVEPGDVLKALPRVFARAGKLYHCQVECGDEVCDILAHGCGGDMRKAANAVELLVSTADVHDGVATLTLDAAEAVVQKSALRYDRDGDAHYDIISALQKSIRGSDPDAALHYLARLLLGGDLAIAVRRLLVTAHEDIGLAYPQACAIVKSCCDSAVQLGLPEAMHPLAVATVLLATAPKSNSASGALGTAMSDIEQGRGGEVPQHLRDSHYGGAANLGRGVTYQYPHNFPNHYVKQQYLPDALDCVAYYSYGDNKVEQAAKTYWDKIVGRGDLDAPQQ
ncbi:MAG: replication-associated recombination protein A [Oscillospiraceae bacterium]|nr:replication-associated recombination protein A [Oscillospiraceae bacterium]